MQKEMGIPMTPFQHRLMQTDVNDLCNRATVAARARSETPGGLCVAAQAFCSPAYDFRLVIDETNAPWPVAGSKREELWTTSPTSP